VAFIETLTDEPLRRAPFDHLRILTATCAIKEA
jgi:hypothetical protein